MSEGWIALLASGGYVGGVLLGYRWQFRRLYRRYRAWQEENPNQTVQYYTDYSYGFPTVTRSDLQFDTWFDVRRDTEYAPKQHPWYDFKPVYMVWWPFVGLILLIRGVWVGVLDPFLHPKSVTGKTKHTSVDYTKINELERELFDNDA